MNTLNIRAKGVFWVIGGERKSAFYDIPLR